MNIWVLNALVIELMSLIGIVGVAVTGQTGVPFLVGFNVILPVTLVYLWKFPLSTHAR